MKEHRWTKERVYSGLCLAANLFLYVGFALWDGPVWCRDSESYATMDYTREPAYCTFLWLMRRIVGEGSFVSGWDLTDREGGKIAAQEPAYLLAVIVVQAIVMAVAVWYLAKTVYAIGSLYAAAANVILWGVDALNRFGAKRGSAYFQSIMTEGFGIAFYIFFLLFLYRYLSGRKRRYLLAATGMMVLCTSHHKQLGITLVIFTAAVLLADVMEVRRAGRAAGKAAEKTAPGSARKMSAGKMGARYLAGRQICRDLLAVAAAGALIFLIGHGYNRIFHGVWSFHTGSADKIDSTLLYTATQEDAALFERFGGEDAKELRQLFLQIEEELTERSLRYADVMGEADREDTAGGSGRAAANWVELCSHYADSYDIIGFEVLDPMVDAYVREHHPELEPGTMQFSVATDKVCRSLESVLVHQKPGRLLYLWANNLRKGFVNTVLRVGTVLNWAALVLWICYAALLGAAAARRAAQEGSSAQEGSRSKEGSRAQEGLRAQEGSRAKEGLQAKSGPQGCGGGPLLAALVLLGTLVNAAVVGAIIFPQTRYMIYNMGLFYVCLVVLADGARKGRRAPGKRKD